MPSLAMVRRTWKGLLLGVSLCSCVVPTDGEGGDPPAPVRVAQVTVTPGTAALEVGGEPVQLVATVLAADGSVLTNRAIT